MRQSRYFLNFVEEKKTSFMTQKIIKDIMEKDIIRSKKQEAQHG